MDPTPIHFTEVGGHIGIPSERTVSEEPDSMTAKQPQQALGLPVKWRSTQNCAQRSIGWAPPVTWRPTELFCTSGRLLGVRPDLPLSDRHSERGRLERLFRTLSHPGPVSYTHLRAHETGRNLVCRLLLEKKKKKNEKKEL